ncbi:MAG: protein kinase [Deltaproteobacteria bacterium]|nr:protein kinase [Deltaproteobacteria bacterium]MBK8719765.1 protein kinase [Deltaproteobacteria bacterium]MBP7285258.1 protein kinase [Nannocystaceae bacterium]
MIAPASSSASALVGSVLGGRYDVVRLLGRGGMGEVYEGTHRLLQKRVAIKVLSPQLAVDETQRLRFLREARAANLIAHENVVTILDFGDGDPTYFVMEFLEGDDLHRLVSREGGLRWPRAQGLLLQMARALGAAHARGIVHRDVKPSNIFVLPRVGLPELVKVLDFGIAKLAGTGGETMGLTRTHELMGTVAYMAPEQALGERVDARTDVYSLGIVIYEMLSGKLPFNGTNSYKVLDQHVRTPPPRPTFVDPAIPPAVEALILRALAKQPADRFASMEELAHAIAGIGSTGGTAHAGAPRGTSAATAGDPGTVMLSWTPPSSREPIPPTEFLAMPVTPASAGPTEFLGREPPAPSSTPAVVTPTRAGTHTTLGAAPAMTRVEIPGRRRLAPWLFSAAIVSIGLGVAVGTQMIDDAPTTDAPVHAIAAASPTPAPAPEPTARWDAGTKVPTEQPTATTTTTGPPTGDTPAIPVATPPPATDPATTSNAGPAAEIATPSSSNRPRARTAQDDTTSATATFERTIAALRKAARRKCGSELGTTGVTVTFHVKADGATTLVNVSDATPLDGESGCVAALVRATKFHDGRDVGRHSIVLEPSSRSRQP